MGIGEAAAAPAAGQKLPQSQLSSGRPLVAPCLFLLGLRTCMRLDGNRT